MFMPNYLLNPAIRGVNRLTDSSNFNAQKLNLIWPSQTDFKIVCAIRTDRQTHGQMDVRTDKRHPDRLMDRQKAKRLTDTQKGRQMDAHTNTQTNGWTEGKETDRHTEGQTDEWTNMLMER